MPETTKSPADDPNAPQPKGTASADQVKAAALGRIGDDLFAIDAKAREHGHSLAEILVKAAQDQFGINVRPDPEPEPEDDGAEAVAADKD